MTLRRQRHRAQSVAIIERAAACTGIVLRLYIPSADSPPILAQQETWVTLISPTNTQLASPMTRLDTRHPCRHSARSPFKTHSRGSPDAA